MLTIMPNHISEAVNDWMDEVELKSCLKFTDEERERNRQKLELYAISYGKLPDLNEFVKKALTQTSEKEKVE